MRRIIFICFWLIAGAGVVVLLVAAVNSRSHEVCKGYEIVINDSKKGDWFVDKKKILKVISSNSNGSIKNKPIKGFDLNRIESLLEKEVWVKDAELFFDNNGILKVKVSERVPVARIFTPGGKSFYIDSTCRKLPLSERMTARLPVFTSYPYSRKKADAAEKKLLNQVKELSLYLANDPFWMAQVSQVDISPSGDFELIPVVGNHVIEFGNSDNKEEKFRHLFVFYRQVLAKTGMEKYERIKVQYNNQVIGVKTSANNN